MNEVEILLPGSDRLQTPIRIVVHAMAEKIKYRDEVLLAHEFLNNRGLSAHITVPPNGQIMRHRMDNQLAWHAAGFNVNSLGIEFLVPGTHDYASFLEAMKTDYLTKDQFNSGVEKVNEWVDLHDITHIDRHSTLSPKRKSDPGSGFPWQEFRAEINYVG